MLVPIGIQVEIGKPSPMGSVQQPQGSHWMSCDHEPQCSHRCHTESDTEVHLFGLRQNSLEGERVRHNIQIHYSL